MQTITDNINYDYISLKKAVDKICESYKNVKSFKIGKSCAGRDILALKIGNAKNYALLTAAFHGSEHITTNILLYFVEELCHALENNKEIAEIDARRGLMGRGIIIVPLVNPDGAEISIHGAKGCGDMAEAIRKICRNDFLHWNANFRGVDINHNFNADWEALNKKEQNEGIHFPAPTRYGGAKPESEPETKALCELCRSGRIRQVLALHSQGEVIYYTYGDKKPPRSEKMAEIMATSSGYALDFPVGLAEGGGFKDWFISEFNKPGFTVEVGKGENPLPIEDAYKIYLKIKEMLMLFSIM